MWVLGILIELSVAALVVEPRVATRLSGNSVELCFKAKAAVADPSSKLRRGLTTARVAA